MNRRTFLAGAVAAGSSMLPTLPAHGAMAIQDDSYATLIDLTRCDGCAGQAQPSCVTACRQGNSARFPDPRPDQIRDYWPQKKHEDWSDKKHLTNRLTPYNWLFIQKVQVGNTTMYLPRRCMHCDNPPCAKLCPFGVKHKTKEGPVYIDEKLCFGGAKCRSVCPWSVPQRQAGVGIYTYFQKYIPAGGGVMYKCDLCRERLQQNKTPHCIAACPQQAMKIGRRDEIFAEAHRLKKKYNGDLYGMEENGGTSTIYVSAIPFADIDKAVVAASEKNPSARLHKPENMLTRQSLPAKLSLAAPLLGALAAFFAVTGKNDDKEAK